MAEDRQGWIKLYRSVRAHWLYQEKPFDRYHAWEDILLAVNHERRRFALGNTMVTAERGQCVTSLRKLGERWGWSQDKVKRFLRLLKSDGMVSVESDRRKTVITVMNWDFYQSPSREARHDRDANTARPATNKSYQEAYKKNFNKKINVKLSSGSEIGEHERKAIEEMAEYRRGDANDS